MTNVTILGAFAAGLLSFLSPCVLPLAPPYLCYIAGVSIEELAEARATSLAAWRVVAAALAFVLGFATVFVALGATASVIGQTLAAYSNILAILAGIAIIVMGLHFLGVLRISLLYREARVRVQRPPGMLGAYLMGLAFAFGWTPCQGPVLGAILFLAGGEDTVLRGAGLLFVYSLGLGIPFVLAALFSPVFLGWLRRFRQHLHRVEQAMGVLLVVTGVLFLTGEMHSVSNWLLDAFPSLGTIG